MVTPDDGVQNTETCWEPMSDCLITCFKVFQSLACNYINKYSASVGVFYEYNNKNARFTKH